MSSNGLRSLKKFTSVFMSLVLVVGLMPSFAWAADLGEDQVNSDAGATLGLSVDKAPQGNNSANQAAPESSDGNANEPTEAPTEVAFSQSAIVDGVGIEVTADAGVFPAGATLQAKRLSVKDKAAVEAAVEEAAGEVQVAVQYNFDITVLDVDGNEIQPDTSKGTVNVAFKTDEVADDHLQAAVYHIDGESGEAEELEVATEGDVAVVETEGFSAYSLIFTHIDTGTLETKQAFMWLGQTMNLWDLLNAVDITYNSHGSIQNATSDNDSVVRVDRQDNTWRITAVSADSRQHRITVTFTSGSIEQIIITSHLHSWTATGSGTDTLKIKCDVDNCVYQKTEFTANITARNATYNGEQHGAVKHLTNSTSYWPEGDITTGEIYYEGTGETSYARTTVAPVNAGTYKASFTVTPDGGSTYTVQKTYSIAKAEHNATAPTARTLTYNKENQALVEPGSSTTGTVYYSLDGGPWQTDVPRAMHAGTYTVSWHVGETKNYATYGPKTITVTIGKRPIWISGVTASNKVYDGTTVATVNTNNVVFHDKYDGDNLTVAATGTFSSKNVATEKTVNLSYTLGGTSVDDYFINTNYEAHQKTTKANITKKALTINWQGAGDNAYTGEIIIPSASLKFSKDLTDSDGLAYQGDEVSVTVEQIENGMQKPSKDEGTGYQARVTGLTGGDRNNYSISEDNEVTYNIVKGLVVVNWDQESLVKQYDDTVRLPEFTAGAELTGIKDTDKEYVSVRVKTEGKKDVGTYEMEAELVFADGHEGLATNYTLDSSKVTRFEITKAPLTVTPEGWITYGDEYTEEAIHPSHTFEGFLGDDNEENSVTGTAKYNVDIHERFHAVGVQNVMHINPNSLKSANYDITFATGDLTVLQKPVKLEWYDETGKKVTDEDNRYTYDGKNHTLTAKVVGANENDELRYQMASGGSHIDVVKVATYKDNEHKDSNLKAKVHPNPYVAEALTLEGDGSQNYTLIADPLNEPDVKDPSATQDWYIDPLRVILHWNVESLVYNAKDQWASVTAEVTNAVEGDTVEVSEYSTGEALNVSDYTKIAQKVNDDNYTLFFDKVNLEGDLVESATHAWKITKAPLAVKGTGWITYGEEAKDVRDMTKDTPLTYTDLVYISSQGEKLLEEDTVEAQIVGTNLEFDSTYNKFDPVSYPGSDNWESTELPDGSTIEKSAYTITPKGLTSSNYEITYEANNLAVYPLPVELEWYDENETKLAEAAEYTYDGQTHGISAKVVNILNEDEVEVSSYTGNDQKDSNAKTETEKYTTEATELSNTNYTLLSDPKNDQETKVETVSWDYKIAQLPVELVWAPKDKEDWDAKADPQDLDSFDSLIYTAAEQKIHATIDNLVEGDEVTLTYADPTEPVAKDVQPYGQEFPDPYTTTVTALDDLNYTLEEGTNLSHNWAITPAPLTVNTTGTLIYGESLADVQDAKITYDKFLGEDTEETSIEGFDAPEYVSDYNQFQPISSDTTKYYIQANALTSRNYELTFAAEPGSLIVYPLPVELEWDNESGSPYADPYVYDTKSHTVVAKVVNAVNNDTVNVSAYTDNQKTDANAKAGNTVYTAKATTLDNTNYTLLADPRDATSETMVESVSKDWKIDQATLTSVTAADQTYKATELKPVPTVKAGSLTTPASDYTATYSNNVNAGEATVTVVGKGNYKGTVEGNFTIKPATITSVTAANQTYDGKAKTPAPVVKAGNLTVPASSFKATYAKNVNAGTATVNVTASGNFTGTKSGTFKIAPASISKATFSKIPDQMYTGAKWFTPKPKVTLNGKTLKEGTDYTLSYSGNIKLGTATITAKGKGNYTNTAKTTFKTITYADTSQARGISEKAVIANAKVKSGKNAVKPIVSTSLKTTATPQLNKMSVVWNKASGATNYILGYKQAAKPAWTYRVTANKTTFAQSGLKDGSLWEYRVAAYNGKFQRSEWSETKYRFYREMKGLKATAGSKSISVSWSKVSQATGYRIFLSANKDMSKARVIDIKGGSTLKHTIKGLKSGKTYYLKMLPLRDYKKSNGETNTYVGIQSGMRTLKVK